MTRDCLHDSNEWCAEEEYDPQSIYVNLEKNKEAYTAFEGMQVWKAIYEENCMVERLQGVDITKNCSEETLLFHLISGLHTSINMHVATNFFDLATN